MRGIGCAWAMGVLALCGIMATAGWAEVSTTGDTYDNGWQFFVGYGDNGTGTLAIDAGSVFGRYYGYLGHSSGSRGTAIITGTGSTWTNIGELRVGQFGSGTLRVETGGQVNSSGGTLGSSPGSTGEAVITGAGSRWANSGGFYVGSSGSGTLWVEAGGLVSSGSSTLGYNSGSTGEAVVTGAGSKWTNSGGLCVGDKGSGTLRVEAGAQVSDFWGYVGSSPGSSGEVIITGAGSTWSNSDALYVGRDGSGTLTVSDGGVVSTNTLYASLGDLHGNGSITVQGGAVLDADLVFDASRGLSQTLAFGSGGTLQFTIDGIGSLGAGYRQSGSLRIAEGRSVVSNGGILGYYSGSTGTAIVTGAGSKWTNSGYLYVGRDGSGTLTVSDGGAVSARTLYASLSDLYGDGTITVRNSGVLDADLVFDATHGLTQTLAFGSGGTLKFTIDSTSALGVGYKHSGSLRIADGRLITSTSGYLGYNSGSAGTAIVTGAGSKWTNGDVYVGRSGSGTLRIEAGGQVSNTSGYLGHNTGSTGAAIISGAGSKWTNSSNFYVGYDGSGSVQVEAGGQVSSPYGYLGYNSGSTGEAIITGAGSTWANSSDFYVGYSGNGTLRVEGGGQVTNANGYLGYGSGSTGTAIISGAGSKWTNSGKLYVGQGGSGKLTVSDGGVVSAKTLYASLSDLYGDGTITVQSGVVLDADLSFDASHGPTQALAFGTGGTLQFTANSSSILGVGYKRSGSLRIAEGRGVSSSVGYLGYSSGSTGTATIRGVGSRWTNSQELCIGYYGSGTLRIENGGQVSSSAGYLGSSSGSTGEAIITGAGSKWSNSGNLRVGSSGSTLTVSDGGLVSTKTLYASLSDLYGDGTITAQGVVLDADLSFDAAHGLTQTLAFGSGGTLQLTVDGTGDLGAGYKHVGSLRIADGRSVASTYGFLGYNSGSTGTAVITGSGSKWTNSSNLYVGSDGSGTLRVEAGGQVNSSSMWGCALGDGPGSTGVAVITGSGSKWTNSSNLYVGHLGNGALQVEAGGRVSNASGYLGYMSGSTGVAVITGAGSTWTSSSTLYIGNNGSGTLRVEGGGQVNSASAYLSFWAGARGEAIITGAGSKWTNSGGLLVGNGMLQVEAGGQVSSGSSTLGYNSGLTRGEAIISGAGSAWINRDNLYVGYNGSGTLRVEGGAQVSNTDGYLGRESGSRGEAIITGAGSKWTNSGSLYIGYKGTGTLTVSDGGVVSAKTLYASLSDLYGDGTITVQSSAYLDGDAICDATHGATQAAAFGIGGTLQLPTDATATLAIGYNGDGFLRIADGRSVTARAGYLGYNSGSKGEAVVAGAGSQWTSGILYVGSSGNGALHVEAGGQVSDQFGNLGSERGSEGTAVITGAGSTWSNSGDFYIGFSGSGSLLVEAGGQVSSANSRLGSSSGSTGTAIVTGARSKWTNSGELRVGDVGLSGSGSLTVSDGGQVTAKSLSINSQSTVRLHVSGDRMLVLGDASSIGSVSGRGKLFLVADAFLPGGTYRPIGEYADRSLSWSDTVNTLAVGGGWDRSGGTFTVTEPVLVDAGMAAEVASGMRVVIGDVSSGERAGVSFGVLSSGTTLAGLPLTQEEREGLRAMLGAEERVLSGWDFVGELAGGEALVSFEVGMGAEEVRVWRRAEGGWSEYAAEMLTYDSKGIVSFTVDPASLNASGYAVSGVVPEPMGVGMLMVAAGMGLVRRRRMASAAK